jgi:hypothetical protein
LLRGLVLGLLDDQVVHESLALCQLLRGGAAARLRAVLELGEHRLYLVMVLAQNLEHVRH